MKNTVNAILENLRINESKENYLEQLREKNGLRLGTLKNDKFSMAYMKVNPANKNLTIKYYGPMGYTNQSTYKNVTKETIKKITQTIDASFSDKDINDLYDAVMSLRQ